MSLRVHSQNNPFTHLSPTTLVSTLQSTKQPSGYAPLPTVPREAISHFSDVYAASSAALKKTAISSIKSHALFSGSDVEIVPNTCKSPKLRQIRQSEAQAAIKLFAKIHAEKTSIQFHDTPAFKESCLELIQQLMLRPSGRLLIESLAQCTKPVVLIPGEEYATEISEKNEFVIFLKLEQLSYNICRLPSGEKIIEETPAFISFGHESIHVLHRDWQRSFHYRSLERSLLADKLSGPSHLPQYQSYEEQFTIHGLEGENLLCENALRFEFGLPERCCHVGSIYPAYEAKYLDQIHNVNHEGINWIQNAAELGLLSEVKKLVAAGANPIDGCIAAAGEGQLEVLNYFLNLEGFDPLAQDGNGTTAIHVAAMHNQYKALELFQKRGIDLCVQDSEGRLPLHYAANQNSPHTLFYLIQNGGNPINAKTKDKESALSIAAESLSLEAVKILLHLNAKVTPTVIDALVSARDGSEKWNAVHRLIDSHLDRLQARKKAKKREAPTSGGSSKDAERSAKRKRYSSKPAKLDKEPSDRL
ncbi:MAG: ankyrin repeat domain-containing protein [Verrucomicrobia bacterium]|nr:ankyrin repeat domain-containing protein [Verrucomicrobiota bacterium]